MKGMGRLHYCLGTEFTQKNWLHRNYSKGTYRRYRMQIKIQNSKVVTTALYIKVKLTKDMYPEYRQQVTQMKEISFCQ